jgi:hypothetical protein
MAIDSPNNTQFPMPDVYLPVSKFSQELQQPYGAHKQNHHEESEQHCLH